VLIAVVAPGCASVVGGDATGLSNPAPARCDVVFGTHDVSACKSVIQPSYAITISPGQTFISATLSEEIGFSGGIAANRVVVVGYDSTGAPLAFGSWNSFKLLVFC
jgi:hypothetical protein